MHINININILLGALLLAGGVPGPGVVVEGVQESK
jgi:hypothetical protein